MQSSGLDLSSNSDSDASDRSNSSDNDNNYTVSNLLNEISDPKTYNLKPKHISFEQEDSDEEEESPPRVKPKAAPAKKVNKVVNKVPPAPAAAAAAESSSKASKKKLPAPPRPPSKSKLQSLQKNQKKSASSESEYSDISDSEVISSSSEAAIPDGTSPIEKLVAATAKITLKPRNKVQEQGTSTSVKSTNDKARVSSSKTMEHNLSTKEMVVNALGALKERKGSTISAIKKYMMAHLEPTEQRLKNVAKVVVDGERQGWITRTEGVGASSGSRFKLPLQSKPKKVPVLAAPLKLKPKPKKIASEKPKEKKKEPVKKKTTKVAKENSSPNKKQKTESTDKKKAISKKAPSKKA
ncbi:histone H1, orphon-like [Copidosoma floridanum]|uniref:histone H1, orphon-like n=1 Tax=Copidosoma floridanum TaxID=29053 RepID=UPI0006C98FEC|nr:histone H1, orphon-like [Copidosoma floridanum]